MLKNILNTLMVTAVIVSSIKGYTQSISITGATKTDAGSSQCYTVSSSCTQTGYCWTATYGTISNSCLISAPVKASSSNTVTPLVTQGCTGPAAISVTFNNVSTLTTSTVRVQDNCNNTTSINVTVVPALANNVTVSPSSQSVNCGATVGTFAASTPSGGDGTYKYQWYNSPDNTNWALISGAASATYTPPVSNTTGKTYYHVVVTSFDYTVTSSSASITIVTPPLSAGTISNTSQSINYNTVPATISCSAASGASCSTVTYTYQWYSSPDNTNWTAIQNAGSQNYSPGQLTSTTYFRRLDSYNGQSAYSNTATVTVYPQLQPGTTGSAQTINYGRVPGQLSLSGVSGGNGFYSYQWYYSTDNSTWTSIGYASATSYAPGSLITTTYFRVAVSCNGVTANSSATTITVNPQLIPGTITPGSITIASGTSPGTFVVNPATGGACNNSFGYQWQSSTDNVNWAIISSAPLSYAPGNLSANIYYRQMVVCGTDTEYTNTSVVLIGALNTSLNYVRERDIVKPGVTDSLTASQLASPADARQITQYFDGLTRPIQVVNKQISPLGFDQVTMQVYDAYERELVKYLPYISPSSDGNFKPNAFVEQNNFNSTQYPGEQYYYGQVNYEMSPLNRLLATYAPGSSWVGSSRGVQTQALINTANDSVRIWIPGINPSDLPTTTATYNPGTLFRNVTVDERGNQVVEYKDLQGHVVLKKAQLSAAPGTAHVGWLCTYYVYDDLGNLRFVLQPAAVTTLLAQGNWMLSTGIRNELCFYYGYDPNNRMSVKKVPGAGEAWMVYDARDRLVMIQDSSLRFQGKWLVTKYDNLNRPDSTGLLTDANNLAYHQNLAANSSSYPNTSSNFELLTQTYYDNYIWTTGTRVGSSIDPTYINNGTYFNTSYNTSPAYAQQIVQSVQTTGMLTGSMTKVIGTASQYLYAVSFYDDRGRVIQIQNINYTGGKDIITSQYDFSGKVLRTLQQQQKNGNNAQSHIISNKLNYDGAGRLLTAYKNIDNAPGDQLIATSTYNELGQLQNKAEGNSIENLAYAYNIRGWLSSINKNYLAGTANNYFGMELAYDKTTAAVGSTSYTAAQFNGNIGGMIWKSKGDGINRKYDFTYDNVNRLTAANFVQNTSGSTWDNGYIDFTTNNLSYDANGNIINMNQKGFKVGGSTLIDQLSYTYQANSNKLSQVNDAVNDPNSKLGDFHYSGTKQATDYSYDGNGNLTLDNNKAISSITYNYLNLPSVIAVTGKGTITYTYDAAGNKLQKVTSDNTVSPTKTTTTLYLGTSVYQNDTLQFIGHEEGRTRWAFHKYTNGNAAYGFEYDYFLKDHLGDIRMVLTQQKDTSQYIATMEAAYRATENQLFYNIPQSCYSRASVSGYPADNTTTPNDSIMKLNGNGQKIGAAIVLKVMSGDVVDIACKSYYISQSTTTTNSSLNDALNSFANGIVSVAGGAKGSITDLNNTSTSPLFSALNSFLPTNDPSQSAGKPKAFLNWILLDDQLKYVSSYPQSGAVPIGNFASGTLGTPGYSGIPISKNGYLYIYVSNESQGWDVFFDNLSVKQYSGPILEETHYYPFGLTMAGISSQALKSNYAVNKYRFNKGSEFQNKEFSDGSGLEMYATPLRSLDPQLGRWWQVDPKPDYAESPYSAMGNNPILKNDPLGDTVIIRYASNGNQVEVRYHDKVLDTRYPEIPFSNLGTIRKDDNNYSVKVASDLNEVRSYDKQLDKRLKTLETSKQLHYIELPAPGSNNGNSPASSADDKAGIPTGSTTGYDPSATTNAAGMKRDPKVGLGHELLGHGYDSDQGKSDYSTTANGIPMYEVNAVKIENKVRAKTGDPQKTTYGGKTIDPKLLQ